MTTVIKVGGNLAADEAQCAALANDIDTLLAAGEGIVIVHGGGPQATSVTKRLGLEPNIVGGRRITDAATLEVVKMVLGGLVNIDLTTALRAHGVPAVGLSGSSGTIQAEKRPPRIVSGCGDEPVDFGFVGDIVAIDQSVFVALLDAGHVPVTNSLGCDDDGQVYNINADIAATRIARSLAARLVLTTGGVRGVLTDKDDSSTRIARLTESEARHAIAKGVIVGGMIPKVEESLAVLSEVGQVHILGALEAGDLVAELAESGSRGTVLVPDGARET